MLLAETVTFDTGEVVVIVVVFLLAVASLATVAVGGVVTGRRVAADPTRTTASVLWGACVGLEVVALLAVLSSGYLDGAAVCALPLGAALLARFAPRR